MIWLGIKNLGIGPSQFKIVRLGSHLVTQCKYLMPYSKLLVCDRRRRLILQIGPWNGPSKRPVQLRIT